mmetsp:Transcript_12764/g.17429  ORF Transcript_12764/g.17429 Transcript_12764/m.17429 type:complete len:224 (-) Transcript_12764:958-1629(-)
MSWSSMLSRRAAAAECASESAIAAWATLHLSRRSSSLAHALSPDDHKSLSGLLARDLFALEEREDEFGTKGGARGPGTTLSNPEALCSLERLACEGLFSFCANPLNFSANGETERPIGDQDRSNLSLVFVPDRRLVLCLRSIFFGLSNTVPGLVGLRGGLKEGLMHFLGDSLPATWVNPSIEADKSPLFENEKYLESSELSRVEELESLRSSAGASAPDGGLL